MKINHTIVTFAFGIGLFIVACGGESQEKKETTARVPNATPKVSLADKYKDDPIYITGVAKVNNSDCGSCHMEEKKIVGPTYAEIAAKYEATPENVTMLAEKIIKGGVGNWGEVPMTPHANLSQEDAEDMVKYILLLK
ncbi:c-type cytochrome [Penaeicola halotolerans]|uniref:c-type cytochrome n=1 Tax=Penaeicola halotolerans TaxID=2793196 RepID=UPI001CF87C69|nr:c-type cytochrome [Penaeicola halotolerans]